MLKLMLAVDASTDRVRDCEEGILCKPLDDVDFTAVEMTLEVLGKRFEFKAEAEL